MAGLYVHIPFCARKCAYCSFNSYSGAQELIGAYKDRLIKEINTYADTRIETVYFGGGTPTFLSSAILLEILNCIKKRFTVDADAEITVEANPKTVDYNKLLALKTGGFNRLSIGIQSFCDAELCTLGRLHNAEDGENAIKWARKAGFKNISGDIITAVPHQTMETLDKTIDKLLELEHISAYSLTIEEGTPFYDKRDTLLLPDEDTEREMYHHVGERLKKAGFIHYEISNYAKEGFFSRHNTGYWKGVEYIGVGAGAHSCFGGERYQNIAEIRAYIKNDDPVLCRLTIDAEEAKKERYILGLRMMEGIDYDGNPKLDELVDKGLLQRRGSKICLTKRGIDISNYVFRELI